ncbi:hypothetical protein EIP91_008786 [Steccherinum ochraceum]|uniref:DUF6533 domain-containing protein n=1 Tax=Steccherinum ochraceum TaxID=92696 RepID=A0A4V2MV63_9APHY|nr:hypothetical protein EIP91_008786 [Steccherinum ochraceum]
MSSLIKDEGSCRCFGAAWIPQHPAVLQVETVPAFSSIFADPHYLRGWIIYSFAIYRQYKHLRIYITRTIHCKDAIFSLNLTQGPSSTYVKRNNFFWPGMCNFGALHELKRSDFSGLVIYDTLATLSKEMKHIWRKPFGLITMLFVTQRWLAMFGGLMIVQIPTNDTEVILISVQGCSGTVVIVACRMVALASDFSVLVSTWTKTANTWRESLKMSLEGCVPTLSNLLLTDGTLYFGGLLILTVGGSILRIFRIDDIGGLGLCFAGTAFSSNLIARFILDLRSASDDNLSHDRTVTTRTVSSVQFEPPSLSSEMGSSVSARLFTSGSEAVEVGYVTQHENS